MRNKTSTRGPSKKIPQKQNIIPKKTVNKTSYDGLVALFLIIIIGIIIYSDSFNCSFHFDDTQSIVEKTNIHDLSRIVSLWKSDQTRFIPYLTFALNYHFDKLNVWGYHLINLIIHLINSCLVWWITLLIFSSPQLRAKPISKYKNSIALVTALIFVSHPLATESVTYITQRMASLAALFYFLSCALFMKGRLDNKRSNLKYMFYGGSFVFAVFAFYSKENALTLPFAILLLEIFFFQTKSISINIKNYKTIVTFLGLLCFVFLTVLKFHNSIFKTLSPDVYNDYRTITPLTYLLTQFSVIVKYIQLLIFPVNQNFDYDYPLSTGFFEIKTLICFLLLSSLIVLAIYLFKKNRIISFGILWFFLTLVVESSIVPISDVIIEHRTYLPSFGIFLLLSYSINYFLWDKNKNIAISLIVLIIGINSYLTYQRNIIWTDEISLYSDAMKKSPNKARPYCVLGSIYYIDNKLDEAMIHLNKAAELQPQNYNAYYIRGNVYGAKKMNKEALADYDKSIERNPNFFRVYNNRGNIYKDEKRFDEAYSDYDKALKLNPEYSDAYNNKGTVLIERHQLPEAITNFHKAIELKPDFAIAYVNLAVAELNSGNKDQACIDFNKSLNLGFDQAKDLIKQYCK
jgi:tetratricopeptide (TPR) repeat protein